MSDGAEIRLLYEKGPCYVVEKPSGLLTQAPPGIDSLERRLRNFLKRREQKEGNIYLGVPHRLDRPVSGAIVFARHVRAARRLAEQFEKRTVRKVYWAWVEGRMTPAEDEWRDLMKKVENEPRAVIATEDDPQGREAKLRYRVVKENESGSWIEIELLTGRMHQIRVQCASRGFPILGDILYGAHSVFGEPFEDTRLRAIALHARVLGFVHPMTGEPVEITAPLPAAWDGVMEGGTGQGADHHPVAR